jgi:hypothetical protein
MKPLPKRPYAQIHLPALTPEEAVLLANIFIKASDAIWRAHGPAMAAFLGLRRSADEDHPPPDPPDSLQDNFPF